MTPDDTDTDNSLSAGAPASALLSATDVAALEAAHEKRLAAIAAEAEAAIDAAIAEHFAELDRLEAAAYDALLAHLAARTRCLARLEAAAAASNEADATIPASR